MEFTSFDIFAEHILELSYDLRFKIIFIARIILLIEYLYLNLGGIFLLFSLLRFDFFLVFSSKCVERDGIQANDRLWVVMFVSQ